MPEIPEVRRPRGKTHESADDEGSGIQGSKGSSPMEQAATLTATQETRYRDLKDNVSFTAIVSLVFSYDIPLVDLPARQGVEGRSYGLGAGVSSTVTRHKTGPETANLCPPGTFSIMKLTRLSVP